MRIKLQSKLTFTFLLFLFLLTAKVGATDYTYDVSGWDTTPDFTNIQNYDTLIFNADYEFTTGLTIYNGTIQVNDGKTLTFSGTPNTINCNINNNGKISISSDVSVLFQSGTFSNSSTGTIINNGTTTISLAFTNNGTIKNNAGTLLLTNNITNLGSITNENGAVITGSTISNGDSSNHSATIENKGSLTLGTLDNFAIITNDASGSISGNYNINNKSGGNITNSGNLSSTTNPLSNDDGGTITSPGTITGNVTNNGSMDITGGTVTGTLGGSNTPTGYFPPATYTWTGTAGDSDWTNPANWSSSPTVSGGYPGKNSSDNVAINCRNTAHNINVPADITIKNMNIEGTKVCTINIESGKKLNITGLLTLGDKVPLLMGMTGKVKFTGSGTVVINNMDASTSTLEHMSMEIENPCRCIINGNLLTVTGTGDFDLKGNGTIEFNGTQTGDNHPHIDSFTGVIDGTAKDILINSATPITYTWLGNSTEWFDKANWSSNYIPSLTSDVTLPSGLSNYPILSRAATVNSITFESGATLQLNGNDLTVKEKWYITDTSNYIWAQGIETVDFSTVTDFNNVPGGPSCVGDWYYVNDGTSETVHIIDFQNSSAVYNRINITGKITLNQDQYIFHILEVNENSTLVLNGHSVDNTESNIHGTVVFSGATGETLKAIGSSDEKAIWEFDGSGNLPTKYTDRSGTEHDFPYYNVKITSGSWTIPDSITVSGDFEDNGTVSVSSGKNITFTGTTQTLTGNSSSNYGDLVIGDGTNATTVTISGDVAATSITINENATLNIASGATLTLSGDFTNNGTFTDAGGTVKVTDSITFDGTGATTFNTLSAENLGGKTLSFKSNINVTTLILSGTATGNELTISGNGNGCIGLPSEQTSGDYLSVSSNAPKITNSSFTEVASIKYKLEHSIIDTTPFAHGWAYLHPYYRWQGGTTGAETDWDTAANWYPPTVPSTDDDEILIETGKSYYPVISSSKEISKITMEPATSLTTTSGAKLTITGTTAILAGTISGQIECTNTAGFTTDGDITLNDAVITGDIDVDSNKLTTTGSTTLKGDVTSGNEISVQGDLTVEGAVSQPLVFEGSVWQNFTDKSGNNYDIEIKKDDPNGVVFYVGGTITTLKINSLTITKNIDSVTPANGSTTFSCPAEITTLSTTAESGDIIFNEDTTLKNDTTFSQNAYLVVANGKTLSAATKKITFAGTGLSTRGKISADSFENTGTLSENAATEYEGDFTNNGTFTADNAVTVSGSFTNNTGKTSNINNSLSVNGNFVDNGIISFDTDSGTAGYITLAGVTSGTTQTFTASATTSAYKIQNKNTSGLTFLNNLTISDYVDDLTATETLTFGDATSDTFTISAATFTRTAGPTVINGKVTGSTLDFGTAPTASAVSVKDGAELSVSAGLTASDLTIEGGTLTSTATSEIELTGTKINTSATLNGGTGGLKLTSAVYNTTTPPTLTTNGKVNISTGKLTSLSIASGNTSLSGTLEIKDITFAASSTLTANNNNITVTGTWDNTAGGTFVPGTGAAGETVTFTGAASSPAASTVKGPTTFNDVTFNAQVNIENTNSFNNLTFTAGASGTITTAQTVNGLTTINNSTNSLSFTHASNIFAGGVKIGDSATGAYAGDITLTGTGASSAPIQLNVDKYANRLTLNSPVELLGNVKVTTTQTYNSTVAINSNSELTAMLATFAGNITGATGTTFTVSAKTVIANDITISPTTVTFINTINDSTAGTHTLTFDSATEVTFKDTIGNTAPLKSIICNGTTNINTESVTTSEVQQYAILNIQQSTTLSAPGTATANGIKFTGKITGTTGTTFTVKNANSTWGPNASSTNISVATLDKIIIINDTATDYALDLSKATIPANLPFEFKGNSTAAATGKINFAPATQIYGHILVSDNANLNFTADFKQTDNDSESATFEINNANVTLGTTAFIIDYLKVTNNGKFTQTGNNGNDSTDPATNIQSVHRMENRVVDGITWDSGNTIPANGGSLGIKHGTYTNSDTPIHYNYKKIDLYAGEQDLEGTFWNLIIPSPVSVKNTSYICIRNNFTIENGGQYNHNGMPLYLGTDRDNPGLDSSNAGVFEDKNTTFTNNLGDVTINASGITKTTDTNSNFLCTNLTITSGTTFAPDSGYDIEISGNFTDDGTLTLGSGKKIIFTGSDNAVFKPGAFEYQDIQINKTGEVIVASSDNATPPEYSPVPLLVKDISITNSKKTDFYGPVTISGTLTNPDSTGAITFQANTTVTNDVTFYTTGTVTFGDSTADDDFTFNAITHTVGSTILKGDLTARSAINFAGTTINGTVTSQNSSITLGDTTVNGTITSQTSSITTNKLTLTGDTSVKANTNITINDSISGSDYQLTLDSPAQITLTSADLNKLTIKDTISPATPTSSIVITGGEIKTQEPLTIPFDTTLTGSTTLSVKNDGTGSLFFPSTITIDLQNNPLTINAYTQLHGKFTSSTSSSTAAITINNDAIINNTGNTTELNVPLTCQNLVLYNGELKTSANITTTKDLVLYGADYNETDQKSNLGGMYTYKNRFNNTKFEKSALPDGNALPVAPFTGTLTTNGNVTIQAGHNFYANGLTATSNGTPWNLKINKNKNTTANFAEAYYCNFTASPCTVSCYTAGATADSAKIAAEVCTVQTGYEAGWDLADFEITKAYTVHDNLIYIEFNRNVRTADNELTASSTNISRIKYQGDGDSGPQTGYAKVYINENLKTPTALSSPTNVIYLSAHANIPLSENVAGKWNSDASGISSGRSGSKDTHNVSHNSIPYLNIPRNALDGSGSVAYSSFITDEYGKRLLHYYSATPDISAVKHENGYTFTDVSDKSRPVIVAVKTGQELHQVYDAATGESSQHSYDSHNFIEFIYSESVSFGSTDPAVCDIYIPAYDASENNNVQENVRVSSKLGALTGNITAEGQLTFAALGSIEKGKIHTGKDGATDATVNAFYRDNPYSIKISIAGWTDGTVTDRNGNEFKNWVGYIESAVQPEGKYKLGSTTPLVFDQAGNAQKESDDTITVNSTDDGSTDNVYGNWDISEPVFAPCRLNLSTIWGDKKQSEAVGTGSGSTLDRIEFHLFDNTPAYDENDEAYWFSQKGWCKNDSALTEPVLYDDSYTYCADIIGGARQYDTNAARRTQGGIRFSTTVNNATSFKYSSERSTSPSSSFKTTIDGIYATVQSSIFTGTSDKSRSNDDPDGCYFALGLSETNLPVTAQFTVSYDDSTGYITDLAGNRLRSDLIYTIDRTPPSIDLCLSPINQDKLFIIFVKSLVTDSKDIKYTNNSGSKITINETLEQILPYCFDLIQLDENGNYTQSNDLKIDTSTPAKIELYKPSDYGSESTSEFTFVTLKLNRNLTLKDIETLHLRLYYASQYQELSRDPVTSLNNSRVTFIQDSIGNYTSMYTAHALSDFVIGAVNPLYAYDTGMTYQDEIVMNGLYEEGSWAVHDFEADQQNYGTLPANHPVSIVTQLDDGTTQKDNLPPNVRIFLSNEQDAGSVAGQFNIDFNKQLRVWLPDVTDGEFLGFALNNNTNYSTTDSELLTDNLSDGLIFNVSQDITTTWKDGDQITFLFGLLNTDGTQKRIYNSPYYNTGSNKYDYTKSTAVPLYSMRLHDPSDILSLDLWSFKVHTLTEQRGGVTILNNVINVTNGEKTAVKVNLPKAGKLNVMVTTLDGNIIQYLNHGQTSAGEHYYSWNGKNKAGTPVARGIYFIRVVGNGIDETRKVMVVK